MAPPTNVTDGSSKRNSRVLPTNLPENDPENTQKFQKNTHFSDHFDKFQKDKKNDSNLAFNHMKTASATLASKGSKEATDNSETHKSSKRPKLSKSDATNQKEQRKSWERRGKGSGSGKESPTIDVVNNSDDVDDDKESKVLP